MEIIDSIPIINIILLYKNIFENVTKIISSLNLI